MASGILRNLPEVKTSAERRCEELTRLINVAKGWGRQNLESVRPDLRDSIKTSASLVEAEIGLIDQCLEGLIESRKILEDCESVFDEYVMNASSNIPTLEQLSARVIKENPEMFPVLPHYMPRTFLKKEVDEDRTTQAKRIRSRKKKRVKTV